MSDPSSFFLQFMAMQEGKVIPYTQKTLKQFNLPEIDNQEVTKICSSVLGSYGIGYNPFILDFITLTNHLNKNKRLEIEVFSVMGLFLVLLIGWLYLVSNISMSFSLSLVFSYFFFLFMPKQRRYISESFYLFFTFLVGKYDTKPKTVSHELFNVSGLITIKLNEYLLEKSTPQTLLIVDELSVNDFLVNVICSLQKKATFLDRLKLCFTPSRHLKKAFFDDPHLEA